MRSKNASRHVCVQNTQLYHLLDFVNVHCELVCAIMAPWLVCEACHYVCVHICLCKLTSFLSLSSANASSCFFVSLAHTLHAPLSKCFATNVTSCLFYSKQKLSSAHVFVLTALQYTFKTEFSGFWKKKIQKMTEYSKQLCIFSHSFSFRFFCLKTTQLRITELNGL